MPIAENHHNKNPMQAPIRHFKSTILNELVARIIAKQRIALTHLLTVVINGALVVNLASGADDTWVGNTSANWNTGANWSGNVVPVAGDNLLFGSAGSAGAGLTNDMAAGASFTGITFNSGASAYTFNGNSIALTGGMTNSSAGSQTNSLAIALGANITLNDGGGGMALGGAISGSFGLTNTGNGTVYLNTRNSFTGGATINNGTLQLNAGASGSGNQNGGLARNCPVTVNPGGTLIGGAADAFGYGSDSSGITINGGTVSDTAGAFRITLPNLTFIGGTLTSNPGNAGSGLATYTVNGNGTAMTITTVPTSTTATISALGLYNNKPLTFNIPAGTVPGGVDMQVSANVIGTSGHKGITKIGTGRLVFSNSSSNTTYGGALTLINQGVLALTGNATITASPIEVTNGATFDVSGLSSPFVLAPGLTLGGNGTVIGDVTAASSIINAGLYGGSTLTFQNSLTLGGAATLDFVLSGAPTGANSKIAVTGNLNYNGANTISLSGFVTLQNGTYPLITYGTETPGGTWILTGFTAGTQTASIVDTGAGAINLVIAPLSNVTNVTWLGDGANNFWDTTSSNWLNGAITNVYSDGDVVTFNDSGSTNPPLNLEANTVQPAAVVVTNNTFDYTFSATSAGGAISGTTSLLKLGSGRLTLAEGSDNFSGGIIVGGGSLVLSNAFGSVAITGGMQVTNGSVVLDQVGTISGDTLIQSGASVQVGYNDIYGALPSGTVTLNGNLVFDQTGSFSVANVISGASTGNLIVTNSNNVTLSGVNTFTGNIRVNSGTLTDGKVGAGDGSTGGLGAAAAGRTITIASGATLILAQNAFGAAGVVNANMPSIVINGGTVNDLTKYTTIGNVTLNDGANLTQDVSATGTYQGYQFLGSVTVGGSSYSTIASQNGVNDHLGGNTVFNVADVTGDSNPDLFVTTGLQNQSGDFSTAPGGLTKTGAGTMQLSGVNTYTGNTTINAGTLALNGSASLSSPLITIAGGATFDVSGLSPAFALASAQTLSNSTSTAVVNGNADASLGQVSLAYASGTPSLAIMNGTLTLASTSGLTVNNTGAPLAAGSYRLVAAGAGGAVAVSDALPTVAIIGGGIAPDASASLQIVGGELYLVVKSPVRFTGIKVSGTTLTITATGGLANESFVLLQSTNVTTPLANWMPVLTNNFDGSGNLNLSTNIINPSNSQEFYILSP